MLRSLGVGSRFELQKNAMATDQAPAPDTSDPEVLDLTNSHLQTLAGVQINATLTLLDLTANRLESIDPRIIELSGERGDCTSVQAAGRRMGDPCEP